MISSTTFKGEESRELSLRNSFRITTLIQACRQSQPKLGMLVHSLMAMNVAMATVNRNWVAKQLVIKYSSFPKNSDRQKDE